MGEVVCRQLIRRLGRLNEKAMRVDWESYLFVYVPILPDRWDLCKQIKNVS